MNKQDKIIAYGGIATIVILAIVAICLLLNIDDSSNSLVKIKPEKEQVKLVESDNAVPEVERLKEDVTIPQKTDEPTKNVKPSPDTLKSAKEESSFYTRSTLKEVRNYDTQMAELYGYWDEYQLEAVGDLIRLERVKMLTKELAGTDRYYYYGETDTSGLPNGKGLAIYADNTYYFGEWNKGLRSGSGMWLRIYPDGPANVGDYTGVLEHQYNGQFKNDLPNGNGQEHYTYDSTKITGEMSIANVIGGFKNGYYNGELYIMTMDEKGTSYDWYANATDGKFDYCEENVVNTTGKKPVLKKGEDNDHSTDSSDDGYYWMLDLNNSGFGIYSLKKAK